MVEIIQSFSAKFELDCALVCQISQSAFQEFKISRVPTPWTLTVRRRNYICHWAMNYWQITRSIRSERRLFRVVSRRYLRYLNILWALIFKLLNLYNLLLLNFFLLRNLFSCQHWYKVLLKVSSLIYRQFLIYHVVYYIVFMAVWNDWIHFFCTLRKKFFSGKIQSFIEKGVTLCFESFVDELSASISWSFKGWITTFIWLHTAINWGLIHVLLGKVN